MNESATTLIPELEPADSAVLARLCQIALDQGYDTISDLDVLNELLTQGLAESQITDALQILHERGLIKAEKVGGRAFLDSSIVHVRVTLAGFGLFARHKFPDFDAIVSQVAGKIVNEGVDTGADLTKAMPQPPMLVEHVVELLENKGLIKLSRYSGGYDIHNVSPSLKRLLRQ